MFDGEVVGRDPPPTDGFVPGGDKAHPPICLHHAVSEFVVKNTHKGHCAELAAPQWAALGMDGSTDNRTVCVCLFGHLWLAAARRVTERWNVLRWRSALPSQRANCAGWARKPTHQRTHGPTLPSCCLRTSPPELFSYKCSKAC